MTDRRVGLLSHPSFGRHDPGPDHPDQPRRFFDVIEALRLAGLCERLIEVSPRKATREEILRVHMSAHLDAFDVLAARGWGGFDRETTVSKDTGDAVYFAAGAVCTAAEGVLVGGMDSAFCAVRPPGHHAERERGMGFCFVNNVAVGAAHARSLGCGRVAIVDWDLHHGNGTQDIFYTDPNVLYCSIHQWPQYPGTGWVDETGSGDAVGTVMNRPLPTGSGDDEVLGAWDDVCSAVSEYAPEIVFVSAGFDGHANDPMDGLRMSTDCFSEMTRRMLAAASCCDGRVVSVLEGGYDPGSLGDSAVAHVRALLEAT